ncbi:MAG: transporter substrate-binding domain-containing protein, partial [Stenotrophomonas maltophilia]|nr:transporter substrate-binding domain-containing protein [Stenotrophomonas maltophilia]
AKERFTALQSGEVDILSRNTTMTSSRDAGMGLKFPGFITYYDGIGFLVNSKLGVKSAKELDGATICIQAGTTTELNVSDYFRGNNLKYTPITFDTSDESAKSLESGRCDVLTSDKSQLFAQRSNLLSPGFWGMLRDILRFNRQAPLDLQEQRISAQMTLGEYLQAGNYGPRFIRHYIVPMGAAIWSMPLADMLGFPLQFFVRFFKNHGLLSVNNRPQWCVIEGGSSRYIEPLTRSFGQQIRLNCPVQKVERTPEGVVIHSADGREIFDKVVFACHSDQALALLDDPSQAEQQILGAITYADNDVALHTDTRLLPDRPLAWASWNYRMDASTHKPAAVTYA